MPGLNGLGHGVLAAIDSRTNKIVWKKEYTQGRPSGALTTAGGLLLQSSGDGNLEAYDAKSGDLLWKFNTGAGIFSSPAVYMVNGEEFVTVASGGGDRGRRGGDLILSFALPPRTR